MPNGKISLGDRRVVIAVLVAAAALAAVNWRVFQPLRTRDARESAQGDETLRTPDDLGEMVVFAASQLSEAAPPSAGIGTNVGTGSISRDPFLERSGETKAEVRHRGAESNGLFCSAVLLGGGRPAAIINGRVCHPGDSVAGYVVDSIGYERVVLAAGYRRVELKVGTREPGGGYSPVVSDSGGVTGRDTEKDRRNGVEE